MAALKPEKDEGESEGPLQKPSLLSLQNTALKVRDGNRWQLDANWMHLVFKFKKYFQAVGVLLPVILVATCLRDSLTWQIARCQKCQMPRF